MNKPVAWINKDESGLSFKNHGGGWEPPYTHPIKEQLTDEEIKETIKPIIFMKQIIEALAIASVAGTVFFILVMWALAAKYVEQQYFGY